MFAEVILSIKNKSVDRAFDYIVPDELAGALKLGMRVSAPFGKGNRLVEGYVVDIKAASDYDAAKLKPIDSVKDDYPLFSPVMMELTKFMREKYYTTLSACLQCVLPPGLSMSELTLNFAYLNYDLEGYEEALLTVKERGGKQAEVIRALELEGGGMGIARIRKLLGISQSPLDTLRKKGLITFQPVEIPRIPFKAENYQRFDPHALLPEQAAAFERIRRKLEPGYNGCKTVLLHGVTGSGKTELYMRIIALAIEAGKQAIALVPEIALTPQTVKNFVGRFSEKASVTHSRLSDGERFEQWKRAKNGAISVMIGPRSAIFTPFDNLGVIIIDEEHESTYKSEITPKYDARELAEKLSELTGCLVVLGSATPSVQSYFRAENGEIELCELKNRVNNRPPLMTVVDMRRELISGNRSIFSRALQEGIAENLAKKELTILFLNRRGHSTFVSCRACGYVMSCDKCSINYTYHLYSDRLVCHYCGDEARSPEICPACGSKFIKFFGAGTQKVEEEIRAKYPSARVMRMDLDTTSKKHSHERIYQSFLNGGADILIGTQMIAKGLDFPRVTLVGIIAADINIHMGDFRSAERAFQLITQVSGRAGRAALSGRVFIQTYNPEHYSVKFARDNDYAGFYEHEIALRRQMDYPPFTHLFVTLITGESEKAVVSALIKLYRIMRDNNPGFELYPPTPAAVSKIKNSYRHKIIVKARDEEELKRFVFHCLDELAKEEDLSSLNINNTLDPLNIP